MKEINVNNAGQVINARYIERIENYVVGERLSLSALSTETLQQIHDSLQNQIFRLRLRYWINPAAWVLLSAILVMIVCTGLAWQTILQHGFFAPAPFLPLTW